MRIVINTDPSENAQGECMQQNPDWVGPVRESLLSGHLNPTYEVDL